MAQLKQFQVTIASGGSLSGACPIGPYTLCGINMPAGWDAAAITIQDSEDDLNFEEVYDASGNEYTLTVAAARKVVLPVSDFASIQNIKLRSGTVASAVNQTASRTITLIGILL